MYHKATVIKTVSFWHEDRHIDQWNWMKRPETNIWVYDKFISDKYAKTIQWEKNSLFNNGARKTRQPHAKE